MKCLFKKIYSFPVSGRAGRDQPGQVPPAASAVGRRGGARGIGGELRIEAAREEPKQRVARSRLRPRHLFIRRLPFAQSRRILNFGVDRYRFMSDLGRAFHRTDPITTVMNRYCSHDCDIKSCYLISFMKLESLARCDYCTLWDCSSLHCFRF